MHCRCSSYVFGTIFRSPSARGDVNSLATAEKKKEIALHTCDPCSILGELIVFVPFCGPRSNILFVPNNTSDYLFRRLCGIAESKAKTTLYWEAIISRIHICSINPSDRDFQSVILNIKFTLKGVINVYVCCKYFGLKISYICCRLQSMRFSRTVN